MPIGGCFLTFLPPRANPPRRSVDKIRTEAKPTNTLLVKELIRFLEEGLFRQVDHTAVLPAGHIVRLKKIKDKHK